MPQIGQLCLQLRKVTLVCAYRRPAVHGFGVVRHLVAGDDVQIGLEVLPVGVALLQRLAGVLPPVLRSQGFHAAQLTAPTVGAAGHGAGVPHAKGQDHRQDPQGQHIGTSHGASFFTQNTLPCPSTVSKNTWRWEVRRRFFSSLASQASSWPLAARFLDSSRPSLMTTMGSVTC